jgi:hypothetical protein
MPYNVKQGYDARLEAEFYCEEKEYDTTKLRIRILNYNDGLKKIQIDRMNRGTKEKPYTFTKIGRLKAYEAKEIARMLITASDKLIEMDPSQKEYVFIPREVKKVVTRERRKKLKNVIENL